MSTTSGSALAALLFSTMASVAVAAEEPRQVEAAYEVTLAGLAGLRVEFRAQFDGARYDIQTHSFKQGVLRALTAHFEGYNRAWGRFTSYGAEPAGGSLSIVAGDKPRTWEVRYGQDGALQESHRPEWKPQPLHVIPVDKKNGSLDPLSGALVVAMAGDAACNRMVLANDGKRRVDVTLRKVGVEAPAKADTPGARGDLLVCDADVRRAAGEFDTPTAATANKPVPPVRLWLARLDDTPFRYPVKFETASSFGVVRGRMVYFRERSPSEREKVPPGRQEPRLR